MAAVGEALQLLDKIIGTVFPAIDYKFHPSIRLYLKSM
jgi:hypothetical protein